MRSVGFLEGVEVIAAIRHKYIHIISTMYIYMCVRPLFDASPRGLSQSEYLLFWRDWGISINHRLAIVSTNWSETFVRLDKPFLLLKKTGDDEWPIELWQTLGRRVLWNKPGRNLPPNYELIQSGIKGLVSGVTWVVLFFVEEKFEDVSEFRRTPPGMYKLL